MLSKTKLFYVSFALLVILVTPFLYMEFKGLPFQVEDTLLVVSDNNHFVFDYTALEKFNDEKYMVTYEVRNLTTVDFSNKKTIANAIGTNYTYPYVYKIPLVEGCFFSKEQQENSQQVVILNKSCAFHLLGIVEEIEGNIEMDGKNYKIIGVIDDGEESNNLYYPSTKNPNSILVSYEGSPQSEVTAALKQLGVTQDDFLIVDMTKVIKSTLGKPNQVLAIFTLLVLFFVAYHVILTGIKEYYFIATLVKKQYYIKELFYKKPFLWTKLLLLMAIFFGSIGLIIQKVQLLLLAYLQSDINWDFVQSITSFPFMREKLLHVSQFSTLYFFAFLVVSLYTVVALLLTHKRDLGGFITKSHPPK